MNNYIHVDIPEISTGFLRDGDVIARTGKSRTHSEMMDIAILTVKLVNLLGIQGPSPFHAELLPYDDTNDNLVFPAELNSVLLGRRINFLRNWKQFEGCIKGANGLGLMAEQVQSVLNRLKKIPLESLIQEKKTFLSSRYLNENGLKKSIFEKNEIANFKIEEFSEINNFDLAVWKTLSKKTIVCSTSSNMGISLHDALRRLQSTTLIFQGKKFFLLNEDEGNLIIWCPDKRADFMNFEKTTFLAELEKQQPPLTKLKTYINRQERDPGALQDALVCGGFFFPTNPQSIEELQNLLFFALTKIASERNQSIAQVIEDPKIKETLTSLNCQCNNGKVYVTGGIDGGIIGLMIPYFVMLEETIFTPHLKAISTWNQASIGAALAAAMLADLICRQPQKLSEEARSQFFTAFPKICQFLDNKKLGKDVLTAIHGVFDLANLQSLAQLLGVVVEKHLSGRGTAYVGLGSSSYSNGNRCYELLKESIENDGPFKGKSTFHPSTHTLNGVAQALIYGEDFFRCIGTEVFKKNTTELDKKKFISSHVRKPEPAGAAALAGYLLARLDSGTLSIIEIAYVLRIMGFSKNILLKFLNLPENDQGSDKLLQESYQEGNFMGDLAKNILLLLDWPLSDLEKKAQLERAHSELNYKLYPLDSPELDNLNPLVNIYLTGDNTRQPDESFIERMLEAQLSYQEKIRRLINRDHEEKAKLQGNDLITIFSNLFITVLSQIKYLDSLLKRIMKRVLNYLVTQKVKKLKPIKNENI